MGEEEGRIMGMYKRNGRLEDVREREIWEEGREKSGGCVCGRRQGGDYRMCVRRRSRGFV